MRSHLIVSIKYYSVISNTGGVRDIRHIDTWGKWSRQMWQLEHAPQARNSVMCVCKDPCFSCCFSITRLLECSHLEYLSTTVPCLHFELPRHSFSLVNCPLLHLFGGHRVIIFNFTTDLYLVGGFYKIMSSKFASLIEVSF